MDVLSITSPLDDEDARSKLIYNYIPWSRKGKSQRSFTQSRYGKRPITAAMNNRAENNSTTEFTPKPVDVNQMPNKGPNKLDEESIKRFNEMDSNLKTKN
jgi:hypothetical protein